MSGWRKCSSDWWVTQRVSQTIFSLKNYILIKTVNFYKRKSVGSLYTLLCVLVHQKNKTSCFLKFFVRSQSFGQRTCGYNQICLIPCGTLLRLLLSLKPKEMAKMKTVSLINSSEVKL